MLLDLQGEMDGLPFDLVIDGQRVVDRRKPAFELHVHDRPHHLYDFACAHAHPACPPAISSSSLVMFPWRSLLYSSVRASIRLSALSVAFFIDTIRALCSLAFAFSSTK